MKVAVHAKHFLFRLPLFLRYGTSGFILWQKNGKIYSKETYLSHYIGKCFY